MLPPLENSPSAAAPSTPSTSLTSQLKEGGALKDLIDTEDTYVDLLAGIIRKVAGAWSRSNLPPPELDTMFRSIEGIYKANRTFRSRMKDIGNNYPAPKPIGNLLIRWIEDLDAPYTTYCTNYRYGFDTWDPVRSNAKLAKVLKNFSESSSTPPPPSATTSVPLIPLTWTLDELFLLPSARLRYYRKLYSRLLQKTVHGRTDHELLVGAVDTFDRLLNTLNGRRRIRVGETPTSLTPTISETGTMREGDLHSDWPSPTEWSRAATPPIEAAGCSFEFVQDELRNSTLPPTAPAVDTKMPDTSAEVECLVLTLEVLFADREKYRQLLSCRGSSAQRLLDMFQRLLDTLTKPLPTFRSELIVATQRLAGQSGLYPACYEIDNITTIGDYFESSGAFADIYRGTFRGQAVCLKIIRLDMKTEKQQFLKVCSKEAILWGQLSHPSLLLFYGIYRLRNRICFVSPWMEHGDINNYLWNHPSVNRILLVFDIARGLLFLHENKIVHGDLKGPNILVDRSGIACVADFGLSSVSDPYVLA